MVFEKFEAWTFQSPAATEMHASAWQFWGQRGYNLRSTGPGSFQGRSFQSKLGIHRVVDVTVLPSGPGSIVQLRFRADVREDAAVGGAVLAVLLLPVAVIGAAVSWHSYETDWSQERWAFWNHLVGSGLAKPAPNVLVPPMTAPSPSAPSGAPPARTSEARCPSCGTPATGAGKFCASCGTALSRP